LGLSHAEDARSDRRCLSRFFVLKIAKALERLGRCRTDRASIGERIGPMPGEPRLRFFKKPGSTDVA
jgi:hypothetical protein